MKSNRGVTGQHTVEVNEYGYIDTYNQVSKSLVHQVNPELLKFWSKESKAKLPEQLITILPRRGKKILDPVTLFNIIAIDQNTDHLDFSKYKFAYYYFQEKLYFLYYIIVLVF